jgi:hypothetical protein
VGAVTPQGTAGSGAPRRLELADIVQAHGDVYRRTHRLALVQAVALRAIATCRTAALGGHRERCDRCGAVRVSYNSCRNRHCPKCQTLANERWVTARRAELLPLPYFHVVFTLPHDLNPLAQGNPRVLYALLFRAAADTLLTFGRDPRHLGGTLGITAILHTWGQNLSQHLHVHCLVTGGALARDGSRWIASRPSFLFPVHALSVVCRAKFLAGLERRFTDARLRFAAGTEPLGDRRAFTRWLDQLRTRDWVVYAKRPFAGPEQVLAYLGRYTHRVALSNDRLVSVDGGTVRLRWRDYADHDRRKVLARTTDEFLRRFLLHVLPTGFMRIRHFGLLANRHRQASVARCRQLLAAPAPAPVDDPRTLAPLDPPRCPSCGEGPWRVVEVFPPVRHPRPPTPPDSS